jgi:hypothetical protein
MKKKKEEEEEREVGSSERLRVGGTEYIIGFEGSQALHVCPSGKCKLLTLTIEVQFFFVGVGGGGVNGLR